MKRRIEISQRGFTLIEFLLYIVLAVMMVVLLGTIGISVLRSNMKALAMEEMQYDAEFVLEKVLSSVRRAESVSAPLPQSASSTLVLTMSDPSIDPTRIYESDGKVYMQEGGEPASLIGGEATVADISFMNVSHEHAQNAIQIELSLDAQYGVDADRVRAMYRTTVRIPYSP